MQDIEDIGTQTRVTQDREVIITAFLQDQAQALASAATANPLTLEKALRALLRKHKFEPPSKVELLKCYRSLDPVYQTDALEHQLIKKEMRSLSGVLVIAVFTSAHPSFINKAGRRVEQAFSCKHDCSYCPLEPAHEGNGYVAQPRSYLSKEPGVQRANDNDFDPARQVWDRLRAYVAMGHPIDKIELIVLGGTWSEYPIEYRDEFIRDLHFAVNTFDPVMNTNIKRTRERWPLEEEQRFQDLHAKIKIIGLTLETRPDSINLKELAHFRSLGCTRVQIGIQHTDDNVLKANNRGHGLKESKAAIALLKASGFKVDIHLMPNLYMSDVEKDEQMFDTMLDDPELQADDWKIYPCSVVPWSELAKKFESGDYQPYSDELLQSLLVCVKAKIHPWIRLNRIIRDIPLSYISGGCMTQHMRCNLKTLVTCRCIRCREVKGGIQNRENMKLITRRYLASDGEELFISFESLDERTIYGFLRLRVTSRSIADQPTLPILQDCALIRELHVYGKVQIHDKTIKTMQTTIQHSGLGKALVAKAEELAIQEGYTRIAVISGIGVREYYRRLGYSLHETYMIRALASGHVPPKLR